MYIYVYIYMYIYMYAELEPLPALSLHFPRRWCQGTCRGTLRIRNSADLGPYRRALPRALWWS